MNLNKQRLKELLQEQIIKNAQMSQEKDQLEDSSIELRNLIKTIKHETKELRDNLNVSPKSFNDLSIQWPLSLRQRAIHTKENNSTTINGYSIHIPMGDGRNYNQTVNCEGCGKKFRAHRRGDLKWFYIIREPGYYVHCIKECEEYQNLGKIQKCHECKLIFTYDRFLRVHNNMVHGNESKIKKSKGTIGKSSKCPGCHLEFPAKSKYSGKYFKHSFPIHESLPGGVSSIPEIESDP